MPMFLNTLDENRFKLKLLQNSRHVSVKPFAQFNIAQKRIAIFRTENQVDYHTAEGLGHGACILESLDLSRPFRAWDGFSNHTQGDALGWLVEALRATRKMILPIIFIIAKKASIYKPFDLK